VRVRFKRIQPNGRQQPKSANTSLLVRINAVRDGHLCHSPTPPLHGRIQSDSPRLPRTPRDVSSRGNPSCSRSVLRSVRLGRRRPVGGQTFCLPRCLLGRSVMWTDGVRTLRTAPGSAFAGGQPGDSQPRVTEIVTGPRRIIQPVTRDRAVSMIRLRFRCCSVPSVKSAFVKRQRITVRLRLDARWSNRPPTRIRSTSTERSGP